MDTSSFRPIAVTLIRKTLVWTSLFALVICVVQGMLSYHLAQAHFEMEVQGIARTNMPLLSIAIWDIEPEILQHQIETITQQHQVGYTRLETLTGQVFEAGNAALRSSSGASRFDVVYPQTSGSLVGWLEVSPDPAVFYSEVFSSLVTVLAGYGVLTLLICSMLAFVLRRELQQPMQTIAHFVTGLNPGELARPLVLDRPRHRLRDEIDLVAEGFSKLQIELNTHIENLDRLVAERTIQLEEALESIRRLSVSDPLTGVFNRHLFNERFPQELERATRYGRPLCVVFCDIDHFKQINDRYGHAGGDTVLRHLSKAMSGGLRSDIDWLVRFGGEEFVLVLPETMLEAAVGMAERLRARISTEKIALGETGDITVTASFGVAQFMPEDTLETLIKRADAALYAAKAAGRNLVFPRLKASSKAASPE